MLCMGSKGRQALYCEWRRILICANLCTIPSHCRQACSSVRALVVLFCSGTMLYLIRCRHNTPFDACSEAGGDYMTVGAVEQP